MQIRYFVRKRPSYRSLSGASLKLITEISIWRSYYLLWNLFFRNRGEDIFKDLAIVYKIALQVSLSYMTWSLQTKQAHLRWSDTASSLQEETMEFLPHLSSLPLVLTVNGDRLKHNSRIYWVQTLEHFWIIEDWNTHTKNVLTCKSKQQLVSTASSSTAASSYSKSDLLASFQHKDTINICVALECGSDHGHEFTY